MNVGRETEDFLFFFHDGAPNLTVGKEEKLFVRHSKDVLSEFVKRRIRILASRQLKGFVGVFHPTHVGQVLTEGLSVAMEKRGKRVIIVVSGNQRRLFEQKGR